MSSAPSKPTDCEEYNYSLQLGVWWRCCWMFTLYLQWGYRRYDVLASYQSRVLSKIATMQRLHAQKRFPFVPGLVFITSHLSATVFFLFSGRETGHQRNRERLNAPKIIQCLDLDSLLFETLCFVLCLHNGKTNEKYMCVKVNIQDMLKSSYTTCFPLLSVVVQGSTLLPFLR